MVGAELVCRIYNSLWVYGQGSHFLFFCFLCTFHQSFHPTYHKLLSIIFYVANLLINLKKWHKTCFATNGILSFPLWTKFVKEHFCAKTEFLTKDRIWVAHYWIEYLFVPKNWVVPVTDILISHLKKWNCTISAQKLRFL